MKKTVIGIIALTGIALMAQNKMYIHTNDNITSGVAVDSVAEITFPTTSSMLVTATGGSNTYDVASVDSVDFAGGDNVVYIEYAGSDAKIVNPLAFEGVSMVKSGGDVTVTSTCSDEVEYRLSGTATDGSFKIYSDKKYKLVLNGVNITNSDGPAINSQSKKKMTLELTDGTTNTLCDGKSYTACGSEDMKGTIFSEGKIDIQGSGTLNVTGKKKHGIAGDDEVVIESGNIVMTSVASDGIHSNDLFDMKGGTLNISATGDGIDGDDGLVTIEGGTITLNVTQNTTKGIKCGGLMSISGGTTNITTSGGVTVTSGDPSYCSAIKCDTTISISGGNITITASGEAGKGISGDYDLNITGGDLNITTSGGGATYTNTSSVTDSYSSTCISIDHDADIEGGTIMLTSTGAAGKGLSVDGALTIGNGTTEPVITATTSGAKFYVSGSGESADYANPKAIKAGGNMTINSGTVTAKTSQDGGEGLESKAILTINGGTIDAETYDDAINASSQIVVNGGKTYCYASGNDGMDSNGTIKVTGGLIVSSGTNVPEEGIDCDQNTFAITGGTIIGIGGAASTPTSSACTQRAIVYGGSGTANSYFHIQDASGNDILTYKIPRNYNQMTIVFSSAALANSTYYIYSGGTVTGGTDFHGYVTGGTYSGGTSSTSFTASSMVTTVGNTGGGPGGGGGRPGGGF